MEEKRFISALRAGEHTAYQTLVEQYEHKVYNTCIGYLYNSEDAQDIVQEVFVEVFRSISNFNGNSSLYTWMYRITVTKSLELIRKRKRKKRAGTVLSLLWLKEMGFEPGACRKEHPDFQLENKECGSILLSTIGSLRANQRIAFTLHNIEGKSYQEIADCMGVSLGSVESLIFRARRNLQKKLGNYYLTTRH